MQKQMVSPIAHRLCTNFYVVTCIRQCVSKCESNNVITALVKFRSYTMPEAINTVIPVYNSIHIRHAGSKAFPSQAGVPIEEPPV